MNPIIIILLGFGIICGLILFKIFKKNKKTPIKTPIVPTQTLEYDIPVESDFVEPEMPVKPAPVNCQKAIFRAAPEKYSYFDCCGKEFEGEGFQPWEKRAPISIDINKPFSGLDLLDEESEIDC